MLCRSPEHSATAVLAAALAVLVSGLCSGVQCARQAAVHTHDPQHGRLHALLTHAQPRAPPDVSMDEFLRGCAFSAAEYQNLPQAPKWHTASRACDILGRYDSLLMMGDSLTRQLYEGLLQLLRQDLATGALRDDLPPEHFAFCTCNEYHKNCRVFTEAWPRSLAWVDGAPLVSRPVAPCPSAPAFTMQFFHIYVDWNLEPASKDNMALMRGAACAAPNSIVFNGGAPPHEERETWEDVAEKMNSAHAARHLIKPMRNLTVHCGVPPENLIWAPMHWSNLSMIPEKWHERQLPADILAYNAATSAAARGVGLGVFDMYNLTTGVPTLDGTHLVAPSTQLMVHALLSRLDAQSAGKARAPTPARLAHGRLLSN